MFRGKRTRLLVFLCVVPLMFAQAQAGPAVPSTWPQWVRDIRRFEIVAFGSFPFAMLTATFAVDMYRWNRENGLDFSDAGRRYAPWPLKSAGAIAMESDEQKNTIFIAIGISLAAAAVDQAIVQIRRQVARRRAEALPVGTAIITRSPWGSEEELPENVVDSMPDDAQVDSQADLMDDSQAPGEAP